MKIIPIRLAVLLNLLLSLSVMYVHGDETSQPTSSDSMSGVAVDQKENKDISTNPPKTSIQENVSLGYSYVGDADLKSGSSGHLGEQTTNFGYSLKVPLSQALSLTAGIGYNRLDFGLPSGSPLPYNLQTITASLGATYKLSDQWGLFGAIAPHLDLIDNADHIDSQNFELSGAIGATYDPNPNLSLRMGLAVSPDSFDIPVLPVLGVRWRFEKDWTLNLGFPRTSIDYQILPNLRLSPLELGFEGGYFHTDKTYGNSVGMPQLNDRKMYYSEVRIGSGVSYTLIKNVTVGFTAGFIPYREFDFKDANYSPKVDPAPYVQLGITAGF